jgi:hypothetical protein
MAVSHGWVIKNAAQHFDLHLKEEDISMPSAFAYFMSPEGCFKRN